MRTRSRRASCRPEARSPVPGPMLQGWRRASRVGPSSGGPPRSGLGSSPRSRRRRRPHVPSSSRARLGSARPASARRSRTSRIDGVTRPGRGACIDLSGESLPFAAIIEAFRSLRGGPTGSRARPTDPFRDDRGSGGEAATGGGSAETVRSVGAGQAVRTHPERHHPAGRGRARTLPVVEDLHWADRSTLDLMGFLVRNLRHEAVLLLMTCRSDHVERRHRLLSFLSELERSGRAERIELHRFDRSETAEQLTERSSAPRRRQS